MGGLCCALGVGAWVGGDRGLLLVVSFDSTPCLPPLLGAPQVDFMPAEALSAEELERQRAAAENAAKSTR